MDVWTDGEHHGQKVRLFLGVPVCQHPTEPKSLYIRIMFRDWFLGPFTEEEATAAVNRLDQIDPYWDYDCWTIHFGADPLPKDYVGGFEYAAEVRARIDAQRTHPESA